MPYGGAGAGTRAGGAGAGTPTGANTAIDRPAARAAAEPHRPRTIANRSGTEMIPAKASGSFRVVEEKPSSFTLATCSHRSTGGLSIETLPPGSKAPKKKLCQEML